MNIDHSPHSSEWYINASSLQSSLEEKSGTKVLDFFGSQKPKLSVEGLNITVGEEDSNNFNTQLWVDINELCFNLNSEYVWENIAEQIVYTWKYLQEKYEKSRWKLNTYGVSPEEITKACTQRLLEQVQEASKNWRKLINGRVASLLKYENDTLHMQEIPYYSFACSNVSLDQVMIWERSLRDIVWLCNNTNDQWEFMLPNSLWICISVMSKDQQWKPCIIAQDRNNTTTLTQRDNGRVVASASWAININKWSADIEAAAQEEVQEELWLSSNIHYLPKTTNALFTWELDPIHRELWISKKECDFEPRWLVMETYRMNPEVICSGYTEKDITQIQELWKTAESQYESLSIEWISLDEVGDNLSWEKETLWKHFLMSLLAWYGSPD